MNDPVMKEFKAEYWHNGLHCTDEVVLYADEVDTDDATEVADHALYQLCIDDVTSVLRITVGDGLVTVWNEPTTNGHSRQYAYEDAA